MKYYFYKNHFGGGFTNQFVFLMDHLIAIHRQNEPSIVFLDCFKDDYLSNDMKSPFSNIIDINWLNTVVFPNMYIIDLYSISSDVQFGWIVDNIKVNLNRNLLLPLIKDQTQIYEIDKNFKDPSYTNVKPFWIFIESKQIYTTFNELCGRILDISISNQNGQGIFIMNDPQFQFVFQYMPLLTKFNICGFSLWDYQERNVIHLRNEEDCLEVWGEQNGIQVDVFENDINTKYRDYISRHISKESVNIILTARKVNNPVIDWMNEQGYNIYIPFHLGYQHQREQLAVRDLQIATEFGNHVFIGFQKSSFSLLIGLRFKGKTIFIE